MNVGLLIPDAVLYLLLKHTAPLKSVKRFQGVYKDTTTMITLKHGILSTLAMTEICDKLYEVVVL